MTRILTLTGISLILFATGLTTGCSYINKTKNAVLPDKSKVYLKAQELPPLKAPAGIPANSLGDTYPIPAGPLSQVGNTPSLLPPDSLAERIATGKVSPDVLKQKSKPAAKKAK
jgi:uncharacterized lipoprotein